MYEYVRDRINHVLSKLPASTRLIAISKYHPADAVVAAYEAGQRVFGESREQELSPKAQSLPKDIEWHFIGHLQTNKVRFIAPYISMIESVDSLRLLKEINRQAERCGRVIDVLLEVHVAQEESKTGLAPDELIKLLSEGEWQTMHNVRICGLMTMASNTDDVNVIESDFARAEALFDKVKAEHFADADYFKEKSWGMSGDYEIALRHGSTMVRIGSYLFAE